MLKRQQRWQGSFYSHLKVAILLQLIVLETVIGNVINDNFLIFENKDVEKFNHLTINSYTGKVYIGAVNRIFQLSRDLKYQESVEMGPREDSPICPASRVCPNEQKLLTNYYNKILVIDYLENKLIACGSLFQGICTTHDVENVTLYETPANESVVANNSTASTVAFIAPGPRGLSHTHVLYVGVSYTGIGPYRSDIPAVSSRSLDPANMFAIAHTGVTTGTKIMINSLSRERYPIKYIFGFNTKGFSYFITVQGKQTSSPKPFISKLIRICQNDVHYYSYTEVPLECQADDGTHYNLAQAGYVGHPGSELAMSLGITTQDNVLYVVFAKSKNDNDNLEANANSALCVYALSAIQQKFTQNIQDCFNGVGERGLDFINPNQRCMQTRVHIEDDFCGLDINTPLDGNIPIKAKPVLYFPGILLTAVASLSTNDYTVVFLGTSTGHLKKIVVESGTRAFEYSDVTIDEGSAVNSDMLIHNDKHIYVMTENRVTMMKVQRCNIYNTCSECIGARDPFCGWCTLENKCSLLDDCKDAAQNPLYWLSYKNEKCITINKIQPSEIQRTTARMLNITVDNFLEIDDLICVFTFKEKTLITNAVRSDNVIKCATPHIDFIPSVTPNQHYISAILSIQQKSGPNLASKRFTFYDCSTFTSCTQCVSSQFPCDWCVYGHRCTHDIDENCRNDITVTGVSDLRPSIRSGPLFCPRIHAENEDLRMTLVPSGENKMIIVKIEQIPLMIARAKLTCQFNIEDHVHQTDAQLLGDTVYCIRMMFSFESQSANVIASFTVLWDLKPLDNPENIHVVIYKCEQMATNCGLCLESESKYSCGWCIDSNGIESCRVQEQCYNSSSWLDNYQTCPNPQITKFTPTSGPLEGGTNITITGINLGRIFSDINDGIDIVETDGKVIANCRPFNELYEKTTTIVCQVENSYNLSSELLSEKLEGYISVKVKNKYTALSNNKYSFVDPKIANVTPSIGPKSGGTNLHIWGSHMDTGSSIEAFVGDLPCHITRKEPEFVECITSPATDVTKNYVKIKFDDNLRVYEEEFEYIDNPNITSIGNGLYFNDCVHDDEDKKYIVKGIPSGGIVLTVKGTNLNAVESPKIYVVFENEKYFGDCKVKSSNEMKCKTPQISYAVNDDEILKLEYGFIMDNVEEVRNISSRTKFLKFQMFPDPKFELFSEENHIKYFYNDYLILNGKNINYAASESDYIVRIGTEFCIVTSLSRSQLTCRPPASQPLAMPLNDNPNDDKLPEVIVEVGGKLKFVIGKLSYIILPHNKEDIGKNVPLATD